MKKPIVISILVVNTLLFSAENCSLERDIEAMENSIAHYKSQLCIDDPEARGPYAVSFDLLYWHPKTDYTEIGGTAAITADEDKNPANPFNASNTTVNPMSWAFGFKVGLGYQFIERLWNLNAIYTRVNFSHAKTMNPGALREVLQNFGEHSGSTRVTLSSKLSQKIDYQTAELFLKRDFSLNESTAINCGFGAKSAWIDQIPTITNIRRTASTFDGGFEYVNQYVDLSEKMQGIGPLSIFGSTWKLTRHWSVFGEGGLALLFSQLRTRLRMSTASIYHGGDKATNKENKHYVSPNLFLSLGLQYLLEQCEDSLGLLLSLGYESQFYINQSYLMTSLPIRSSESQQGALNGRSLGVYGITAKARVSF